MGCCPLIGLPRQSNLLNRRFRKENHLHLQTIAAIAITAVKRLGQRFLEGGSSQLFTGARLPGRVSLNDPRLQAEWF